MMDRLSGRLAVITGAGTGIGRGIGLELARQGADVVLHYAHSGDGALAAVEEIVGMGRRGTAIQADLTRVDECRRLIRQAAGYLGGLDILVNSTGVTKNVPFQEVSEELYEELFAINVRSFFFCAQEALPWLLERGTGSILNISSLHAFSGMPGHSVYAATKGADVSLTRELAIELAPRGIRVNSIAPGSIEVPRKLATPGYNQEDAASFIPWGRVGFPADIAAAAAFLASDEAEYITGQVLAVDGGTQARMALYTNQK